MSARRAEKNGLNRSHAQECTVCHGAGCALGILGSTRTSFRGCCVLAFIGRLRLLARGQGESRPLSFPRPHGEDLDDAQCRSVQAETPELGTILTKAMQVGIPELCDCGTWNMAQVSGTADSQIRITITSALDTTRVVLEHGCGTTFSGQNLYGATTVRDVYRCASKGRIERDFWSKFDKIAEIRAAAANSQGHRL